MTNAPQTSPAPRNRAERRSAARRIAAAGSAAVLASAAGSAIVTLSGSVAGAAPTDVTTCDDSGAGSLRAAILYAESHSGPDTITISASCTTSSPVDVASTMVVTESLTIVGPGPDQFVLDGDGTTRVFEFTGASDLDVSVSGVTIQNSYSSDDGGGISADYVGDLTVANVVFRDDAADQGGALYVRNAASVTISDSLFEDNAALGGGALYLYSNAGPVVISNSTFVGNTAVGEGGAISGGKNSSVEIYNSTITGNTAGSQGAAFSMTRLYGANFRFLFNTVADNEGGSDDGFYIDYTSGSITFGGNVVASADDGIVVHLSSYTLVTTYSNDFFGGIYGFTADATDVDVDPELEALADNGGSTPTRALADTSPLIDAGPASWTAFTGDGFDQRGTPFVREYNGVADIGAFEWIPSGPPPGPTPGPTPDPTPEPEPHFTG